ncbi:COP-coated vesicle membrane protein erv25 precursor [Trypanosoma conorhini]|uniref:COP-coated vesicle membrane protein erv25 n=1 Tax=Trypanosoma conorhini TaxID=83891 RepID=A0A422PYB2_9TRYP|nr:COP-coated vesicle membrane protein erv25 precursor [Trypanosoma conorhini]RNF22704.1 COP-coated vesicle membrane protein erv25 precursor [Trypanosoma conorhini]
MCRAPFYLTLLLPLLLLHIVAPASASVRFVLKDTRPVCFVEEVDESTRVVSGEYTRAAGAAVNVPARILVSDPNGEEVSSNGLMVGTHAFTAPVSDDTAGQYTLCVQVTEKGWEVTSEAGGILVEFDTDQRSSIMPETEMPILRRQKVEGLEVFTFRDFGGEQKDILRPAEYIQRVENALDSLVTLVSDTQDEIEHLIGRFRRMRRTSESTYTRIWAFGIITALVMVVVTWLQFVFLKSTLRQKKLV